MIKRKIKGGQDADDTSRRLSKSFFLIHPKMDSFRCLEHTVDETLVLYIEDIKACDS